LNHVWRPEAARAGRAAAAGPDARGHVDQAQQLVVLPEAEPERDGDRHEPDDDPRAKLVEMADQV
jgi:hypothetical protein